ncbi:hypothetical protein L0Y65_07210 [Candidatus Micrarchaeota archaeon]|nr:hypothetical protein [Candidatus Micrarchaeota archaeon]
MKEQRVYLEGITCGSCEKAIRRIAMRYRADVREIDAKSGLLRVECGDDALPGLMKGLADNGYQEKSAGTAGAEAPDTAGARGNPERALKYASSVLSGARGVELEAGIFRQFLAAAGLLAIAFPAFFASGYGGIAIATEAAPLILLSFACSMMILASYRHMSAYRRQIACMNGMMAGMTLGMVCGFLVGALIGATNGMFIGSVAGTAAGMIAGVAAGRFSGIMGAMEGMMAGLMSGTMGAMLSVMMIYDNLLAFIGLLFGVSLIILGALSYMMHREAGQAPARGSGTFLTYAFWSLAFGLLLAFLMLFGPKGPITYP